MLAQDTIKPEIIITACQELHRVFEFGVKMHHDIISANVFNYFKEGKTSVQESVIDLLSSCCEDNKLYALYYNDVVSLYSVCMTLLKADSVSVVDRNKLFEKYFSRNGYSIRTTTNRVFVNGKKTGALIQQGYSPSDIKMIPDDIFNHIRAKIVGALK